MSPQLNFQKQFADDVEHGRKLQTIRAYRKDKRDPKPGDTLYLFTGQRTKQSRRLGERICTLIQPVHIALGSVGLGDINHIGKPSHFTILGSSMLQGFAQDDGFENFRAMTDWFQRAHGLPFTGQLTSWDPALKGL